MGSQQIWSKVSDKFAYILVLRGQDVSLNKVTGMSLMLKGKVRKVIEALEQGQSLKEAGGKLVESLNARTISKAEISPGNGSLTLHGEGDRPRKLSFSTEGSTADEVVRTILDPSGRTFQPEQEEIGVIEALIPPGIVGVFGGLLWAGINQAANRLASGEVVEVKGRRRGMQQLLVWVADALGTNGTLAVGVLLLVLVLGWAASRIVWRPERTVFLPATA